MGNRTGILGATRLFSFITAAYAKKDTAATDTTASVTAAAPGSPVDRRADSATIIGLDSAWTRNVIAKNVDSLMTYYAPNAVSYGFGTAPAKGIDALRASYTEMVKATMADPSMAPAGIDFSDDGTMAYDHGTYTLTVTPPGGKPSRDTGAYLNVWKKIDGQWKMLAEMSSPVAAKN